MSFQYVHVGMLVLIWGESKGFSLFIMRLSVRLAPLGARQINHPLCGCASKVIPKKLQTRYNKGVQANCKAKGENHGTKDT